MYLVYGLITSPNSIDFPLFFPSYLSPSLTHLFLLFSIVASVMTKTSVAKDEHDTPMRLCDAKDLRGGVERLVCTVF